jgi:hypothetical protein
MVCMVRMASAQGFAWVVWLYICTCREVSVGFSDPKFHAGKVAYHFKGGVYLNQFFA